MSMDQFNKVGGAVLAVFLVFLLLNFASGKIYGTGEGHDGAHELAYAVEIEGADTVEDVVEEVDIVELAMAADVAAGGKVFGKCKACHKVEDGKNGVGPHLWGVVGRDIAAVDGFSYSAALADMDGAWTLEELSAFLENPKGYAPGTKMSYAGLKDAQDRANLIAWLNEADGSPIDLTGGADRTEAPAEETTEVAAAPAAEEAPAEETAAAPATEEAPAEDTAAAPAAEEAPAEDTAAAPAAEEAPAEDTAAAPAAEEAPAEDTAAAPATEEAPAEETAAAPAAEEAPAEDTAAAPAAEDSTEVAAVSSVFADADPAAGEKVFRKCRACHKIEEGKNGVGPSLWGVVGREIGSVDGFKYSDALMALEGTWTATELSAFLEKPRDYAPGTKMAYAGLRKEADRINLIAYLNEADGSPGPLE